MIKMNKNKNRNSQQRSRYNHSDADQRSKNQAQYSRYIALGKDALAQGDKVEAERNFQYAEHYVRLLGKAPVRNNNANTAEPSSGDEALKAIEETFPISVQADAEENLDELGAEKNEPKKMLSKKRARSKPVKKNEPAAASSNESDASEEPAPSSPIKKKRRKKTTPAVSETEV